MHTKPQRGCFSTLWTKKLLLKGGRDSFLLGYLNDTISTFMMCSCQPRLSTSPKPLSVHVINKQWPQLKPNQDAAKTEG